MELTIINPLTYPGWDELVLTNENYSFFHSSSWARVLCESYKYKPLYFTSIDNDKLSALIPIMEVKSFITGKRGVSLPFTDYCQPIISDKTNSQENINELIDYGKKAGWRYIEWRGGQSYFKDKTPSSVYYEHTLDLIQNEQGILSKFRNSTKRNIKKAVKEKVRVELSNSLESMAAFYDLHCITRKHHGLPPQPFFFFKKICEYIISREKGFTVLAKYKNRYIAGSVFLHFGEKAIYKFGASDSNYLHLRPNNLVMWEAIKWYAQNGFKVFGFGRTEAENQGLLQFKRGWGAKEETLNYYKYDLMQESFVAEKPSVKSSYDSLKMMPLSLLKFAGNLLYRHVG